MKTLDQGLALHGRIRSGAALLAIAGSAVGLFAAGPIYRHSSWQSASAARTSSAGNDTGLASNLLSLQPLLRSTMRTHTRSHLARAALALASGLVLTTLAPLTAQAATSAYQVTSTITVGRAPDGVAVDATTHTIYVANVNGNSVSVINGGAVTSTIIVGYAPQGVAVDATTNTVYVTNQSGNSVSVINGATGAVTSTIPVGDDPTGVAVDATTHTVYVANLNDGTVSVIDGAAASPAVTYTIAVGAPRSGLRWTRTRTRTRTPSTSPG